MTATSSAALDDNPLPSGTSDQIAMSNPPGAHAGFAHRLCTTLDVVDPGVSRHLSADLERLDLAAGPEIRAGDHARAVRPISKTATQVR